MEDFISQFRSVVIELLQYSAAKGWSIRQTVRGIDQRLENVKRSAGSSQKDLVAAMERVADEEMDRVFQRTPHQTPVFGPPPTIPSVTMSQPSSLPAVGVSHLVPIGPPLSPVAFTPSPFTELTMPSTFVVPRVGTDPASMREGNYLPQGKKSYMTLDNGGHPFRVAIDGNKVTVWATNMSVRRPYVSGFTTKIFIGTSPRNDMTDFSGGYGSDEDGNSVLFQKYKDGNNLYWFAGDTVFQFRSLAPIVYFTSPVGNSSVPYPWAQDSQGNIYLLIENKVIRNWGPGLTPNLTLNQKDVLDPYQDYYDNAASLDVIPLDGISVAAERQF